MATATRKKHKFKAEVQEILDIVINSLYTDKEIFIRELVSNASDALEKLRHTQLTENKIFDDKLELEINITTDDTAGTITIQDFGIGMTRKELVENLGTIAHSGSKAFLEAIKEGSDTGNNLIGQFGVGFYSAFMVAKEILVYTHSWNPDEEHLLWTSDGTGNFEIEENEGQRRGSKIVVKLKDDEKDFSKTETVKRILTRYSSFVQFPINLNGERVNTIQALWLRSQKEIKPEEYTEFYKFHANAFDEPRMRLHFSADAPIAINSLLFVPKDNMERMGFQRTEIGVSLYCRNILIDSKPEGLLPEWLRFLRGVVDSADLPLNISRETMQDSALVKRLNTVLTKRFLRLLQDEAKKRPDDYVDFYRNFSVFLKEGITMDFTHREQLGKLLRYESSRTEKGKFTTLTDYLSGMKEDQKEIYYLHAPSREAIESGPYLEAFKARNLEVLFLFETIDEFVMSHLNTFEEKKLVSVDQEDIQLEATVESEDQALSKEDETELCEWISKSLGEKIEKVSPSKRLINNPALVLNNDNFMSHGMRRMMKAMNQEASESPKVSLEINPRHPLIRNLFNLSRNDTDLAELVVNLIYENAMVAAGYSEDPRSMVNKVYEVLERASDSSKV